MGIALVAIAGVRGAILLSIIPGLLAVGAIAFAIRAAKPSTARERQPIRIRVRPVLRGELGRLLGRAETIAHFRTAIRAAGAGSDQRGRGVPASTGRCRRRSSGGGADAMSSESSRSSEPPPVGLAGTSRSGISLAR